MDNERAKLLIRSVNSRLIWQRLHERGFTSVISSELSNAMKDVIAELAFGPDKKQENES